MVFLWFNCWFSTRNQPFWDDLNFSVRDFHMKVYISISIYISIYVYIMKYLVGGIPIPLKKYEFVSWDDGSQLNGEIRNVPNHLPDIYI